MRKLGNWQRGLFCYTKQFTILFPKIITEMKMINALTRFRLGFDNLFLEVKIEDR